MQPLYCHATSQMSRNFSNVTQPLYYHHGLGLQGYNTQVGKQSHNLSIVIMVWDYRDRILG